MKKNLLSPNRFHVEHSNQIDAENIISTGEMVSYAKRNHQTLV